MKTRKLWLPAITIVLLFVFGACSNPTSSDLSSNPGTGPNPPPPGNVQPPEEGTTVTVNDDDDWKKVIDGIKGGGNGQRVTIIINGDIWVNPTKYPDFTFGKVEDLEVTLKGSRSLNLLPGKGNMFRLGDEQTLIINSGNLALNGNSDMRTYSSIVGIKAGAKLILKDGTLANNFSVCGGGVYVFKGGKFEMSGGTISGNTAKLYGGGVKIERDGRFTMSGGDITSNTVLDGDGGGVFAYGTFNMLGGKISLNSATKFDGGGVAIHDTGLFRMAGGTVYGSDNTDFANMRNEDAKRQGHALYREDKATAHYGIFNGDVWEQTGNFFDGIRNKTNYGVDTTITVVNGVLQ